MFIYGKPKTPAQHTNGYVLSVLLNRGADHPSFPELRPDTLASLIPDGSQATGRQGQGLTQCRAFQALLINRASATASFCFLSLPFLLNEGKQLRRGGQEAGGRMLACQFRAAGHQCGGCRGTQMPPPSPPAERLLSLLHSAAWLLFLAQYQPGPIIVPFITLRCRKSRPLYYLQGPTKVTVSYLGT